MVATARWGPHYPGNIDWYRLDWTDVLALDDDGNPTGDSISTLVWIMPPSSDLVVEAQAIDGFRTLARLSGGMEGYHTLTCSIITANQRQLRRDVELPVDPF